MQLRSPETPPGSAGGLSVRPTPQGGVHLLFLVVFAATVWMLQENLLFLLACLCLGGAVVAWGCARRNLAGLSVARIAPTRVRAGSAQTLRYRVGRQRRGTALGVQLSERELRGLKERDANVVLPAVSRGEVVEVSATVRFGRRGRHSFAGLELRSRFPFGLFEACWSVPAPGETLVLPREGRATLRLREKLRGPRPAQRAALRVRGSEVLYGVQEFRPGDDPRRVHWKSSARRGLLVRTQWRDEPGKSVWVVLGTSRGPPGAFERSVSVAATVLRACRSQGLPAQLILGDGADPSARCSQGALASHLERLALVRARRGRQPRTAIRTVLARARPPAVIYVATGPEPGLARELSGAGGHGIVLRADQRSIRRFVRGLP